MDRIIQKIKAVVAAGVDLDGAPVGGMDLFSLLAGDDTLFDGRDHDALRIECWKAFNSSPFIQTAVSDSVGALVGDGFSVDSDIPEIANLIATESEDWRNQLSIRWRQFLTSNEITGELYICLSLEKDESFVHTDMVAPGAIQGVGEDNCGICFHPTKAHIPLVYGIKDKDGEEQQVPSIYVAYQPSLLSRVSKAWLEKNNVNRKKLNKNRSSHPTFKNVGGYHRFITDFEGPVIAHRGLSHLRAVLVWWNLYALMKGVEIDYKRACSSYAYIFKPTTQTASDEWFAMTDAQRETTGIMSPKPPGSSIVMPYNWDGDLVSTQLPSITDSDSDLRELVVAGLNTPSDVVTGTSQGKNFGSVKASRGPWSDRILQKQHDYKQFLIHKFWHPIFFLHSKAYGFKETFVARKAIRFKNKKAVFETVNWPAWKFLEVSMPIFSAGGLADLRSLLLGVKSGSLDNVLGIPKKEIARRLGMAKYRSLRLQHAEEDIELPDLVPPALTQEQMSEATLEPKATETLDEAETE